MESKRLLFPEVGRAEWERFTLPVDPEPYQVIIKTDHSLISVGTELALYTGTHIGFTLPNPPFPMMPQRPGYALVGRVQAVGAAVTEFEPGQRVLTEVPHGDHALVDVQKNTVIPLPNDIDDAEGVLIRMAYIALTAVRAAPMQLGEVVAVYGLGLVGQLAAQLFLANGARHVLGIDLLPDRLAIAQENGILPIPADQIDVQSKAMHLTAGRGPDVVVEATGSPAVAPLAMQLVRRGGRVVLLGSPRGRVELDAYSLIHRKGVRVMGAHETVQELDWTPSARWSKNESLAMLADFFLQGRIQSKGLITHTILPEQALSIYDNLVAKPQAYLGILIDWS